MSVKAMSLPGGKLSTPGLTTFNPIHYQLTPAELIQDCIRKGEGVLSDTGALVIRTGEFTGRSPRDRYLVKDEITERSIDWNDFNQPIEGRYFSILLKKITAYLNCLSELWVRDCQVCADPRHRLTIRVITETPSMNLFAYNMFIRPAEVGPQTGEQHDERDESQLFEPEWQVISAPGLKVDARECGTRQSNAVVISLRRRTILLAGTGYTGEMKKAVFTVLNYLLPREKNILPMHCSANIGAEGDTAIFFGLSGTGKTTLSADPCRRLIGDDEHGWTADNIFNFEGGCYAKCIHLNEEREPDIYRAIRRGALVENTGFYPFSNRINFADGSITENTRVSYPLNYIPNTPEPSIGSVPRNIFFLTCDAYGVLPPIAKLNPQQAMYQFISGYTAKVAGTETGITEPKSTFSACFGAPFLPLHPAVYAEMLGEKIRRSAANVWLINTGWSGGPYLTGSRIKLSYTRAMIAAALEGKLDAVRYTADRVFGIGIPNSCPGVPTELLNPGNTWADKQAYEKAAGLLANRFVTNFEKYAGCVSKEILEAAPVSRDSAPE